VLRAVWLTLNLLEVKAYVLFVVDFHSFDVTVLRVVERFSEVFCIFASEP
jgi:hypothetical protein